MPLQYYASNILLTYLLAFDISVYRYRNDTTARSCVLQDLVSNPDNFFSFSIVSSEAGSGLLISPKQIMKIKVYKTIK